MNIFDDLLAKIEEADRGAFSALLDRNPAIKAHIGDPDKIAKFDELTNWYATNWDHEHGCTNKEFEQQSKIATLESALANAAGDAMNLEELNKFLDEKITAGVVVSPNQMKTEINGIVASKEAEVKAALENMDMVLNRVSYMATEVPYLNQIHQREFNELFDPNDLLTKANEYNTANPNGKKNLRDFYNQNYAAEKIAAKQAAETERLKAEREAEKKTAFEEGRKAALQERVGNDGQMPITEGAPEMGHFQQMLLTRANKQATAQDGKPLPIEAPLGAGLIAAAAARQYEQSKINGAA